jgi:hypothetical protein
MIRHRRGGVKYLFSPGEFARTFVAGILPLILLIFCNSSSFHKRVQEKVGVKQVALLVTALALEALN